jgi:HSP20 family molecular chaperone IbpA
MAPIREMIRTTFRNTAANLKRVIREKAEIEYTDGRMKLETHVREFKVCDILLTSHSSSLIIIAGVRQVGREDPWLRRARGPGEGQGRLKLEAHTVPT